MTNRLVVRGGKVVDGSGLPAFTADVEITDGRITRIGRLDPAGARVLDADGLVVAPGFVDIHTHYDAQLHFEPTASPSSWHGVTTVAVGNCGFSLAPCRPGDAEWTARMLSRVEGMSEEALLAGVPFRGGSMADFLAGLDHRVGVNVLAYAGHCAIRRHVMGEAASERSAKPVHGNVIGYFHAAPDGWRRNLAVAEEAAARGLRYYPMLVLNPKGVHFAFDSTFIFDEYPTWRAVLTLPLAERAGRLGDPEVRATLRAELADPTGGSLAFGWDEIEVVWTARDALGDLVGRDVEAIAAARGADPLDTLLDVAIEDGLRTNFAIRRRTSADERAVIDELVSHPLLMPGSSDGGAHLLTFCGADYTTRLLAEHVPERLSLEQAVAKLSFAPAASLGLWDRGLLRPGMAGDLVVFDPDRVGVGPVELRHDFPAGAGRLVVHAEGYHATIVNGTPVVRDGEPTGEVPGTVIRVGTG